jgi:hypothetical protein
VTSIFGWLIAILPYTHFVSGKKRLDLSRKLASIIDEGEGYPEFVEPERVTLVRVEALGFENITSRRLLQTIKDLADQWKLEPKDKEEDLVASSKASRSPGRPRKS